jgi:flagellin-like protein
LKRYVRKFGKKRGVSPVIAVLLLIAIAVATGILVYIWVTGLSGALTQTGGQQVAEQLTMEAYDYDPIASGVVLYVRNTGTVDLDIDTVYFDGVEDTTIDPGVLSPGDSTSFTIDVSGATGATAGSSHIVKIVTKTGAVFTFTVVAGRTG